MPNTCKVRAFSAENAKVLSQDKDKCQTALPVHWPLSKNIEYHKLMLRKMGAGRQIEGLRKVVVVAQTSELTGYYQQLKTGLYGIGPSDWTV